LVDEKCEAALDAGAFACPIEGQMDPRRSLIPVVLSTFALVAFGCTDAGGQTGEETEEPCIESRTRLGLDEVNARGFSANDVLANLGASMELPLEWRAVDGVEFGPESGTSTMSFRFERDVEAFWIESEPRHSDLELAPSCEDRLVLERSLGLSTSGGALNETFLASLSAIEPDDVWLVQLFEPADLDGRLTLTTNLGQWVRLTVQAHFRKNETAGLIAAGLERKTGTGADGNTSFTNVSLACFGIASAGSSLDCLQ
jgi:hypothetical protein